MGFKMVTARLSSVTEDNTGQKTAADMSVTLFIYKCTNVRINFKN